MTEFKDISPAIIKYIADNLTTEILHQAVKVTNDQYLGGPRVESRWSLDSWEDAKLFPFRKLGLGPFTFIPYSFFRILKVEQRSIDVDSWQTMSNADAKLHLFAVLDNPHSGNDQ
ncbi:MAG: hypothetical protein WC748_03355, partial [Legionellales bacterium]